MQPFSYFHWRHESSFGLNKNQLNASFLRWIKPKIAQAKEKKKRKTRGKKQWLLSQFLQLLATLLSTL